MGDEPRELKVQGKVPILENREQRRARERAQRKGLILPGQENVAPPPDVQQRPAEDPRIGIGHVTDENISHIFYSSMIGLLAYRLPQIRNRVLSAQGDPGHLDVGRNKVVQEFLKTQLEWLLWIDTDMAFQPREFDIICESMHAEERPMVSGLYYSSERRPVAFRNALHPADGRVYADPIPEPDEDGLVEVDGVGFGFVMVHRSLLVEVSEAFGPSHPHRPWFDCSDFGPYQEPPSEDLSFCHRVRSLGVPIYVHTGARIGHVKQYVVTGKRLEP